jgi:hypothetical protein
VLVLGASATVRPVASVATTDDVRVVCPGRAFALAAATAPVTLVVADGLALSADVRAYPPAPVTLVVALTTAGRELVLTAPVVAVSVDVALTLAACEFVLAAATVAVSVDVAEIVAARAPVLATASAAVTVWLDGGPGVVLRDAGIAGTQNGH